MNLGKFLTDQFASDGTAEEAFRDFIVSARWVARHDSGASMHSWAAAVGARLQLIGWRCFLVTG